MARNRPGNSEIGDAPASGQVVEECGWGTQAVEWTRKSFEVKIIVWIYDLGAAPSRPKKGCLSAMPRLIGLRQFAAARFGLEMI